MAGIYDERILGAKQQAETARKLREGMTAPQGQMVSGWYVPPSITQYLAEGLKTYGAGKQERTAKTEMENLQKLKADETAKYLQQMGPQANVSLNSNILQNIDNPQAMAEGFMKGGTQTETTMPDERTRMAALLRGASVNPEAFQPQLEMAKFEMGLEDKEAARKQAEMLRREQMQMMREMQRDRLAVAGAKGQSQVGGQTPQWRYDQGSDTWVAPPSPEFPQGVSTASVPKMKSAENFSYLAQQMLGDEKNPGIIDTTTSGGWMGLGGTIGKVTDSQQQKRFNNLREQMSTELRTVFRIPGEGALSDKEQAQYGVQLPELSNDPALNKKIVEDLDFRIKNKTMAGANPLTPTAPTQNRGVIKYDASGRRIP